MAAKHVFLSYARNDARFVKKLRKKLESSQMVTWLDTEDILAGVPWQPKIEQAIRDAVAMVLVLSPHATKSLAVTYEWIFARGAGVRVIPVLFEKTDIPEPLKSIQYENFTGSDHGKRWLRLLDSIQVVLKERGEAPLPVIRATFCMSDGKSPDRVWNEDAGLWEYVVDISIDPLPDGARRASYEIHDDTFADPKWTETDAANAFATWVQSYGDVLLSAIIATPHGKRRTEITLYDALQRTHGRDNRQAVKRALRDIKDN